MPGDRNDLDVPCPVSLTAKTDNQIVQALAIRSTLQVPQLEELTPKNTSWSKNH